MMKKPLNGPPLSYKEYFTGKFSLHLIGILGGAIWGLGICLTCLLPVKRGQQFPMVLDKGYAGCSSWGVLVWKEFKTQRKCKWLAGRDVHLLYSWACSYHIVRGLSNSNH